MADASTSQAHACMLDDMLLPGTPPSIRAAYASLAERARTASFDELETDVVVLDTETTGLSHKECELIEICAAKLSGGGEVARFHSFVNPSRPIPAEIKALTGIRDLDVAGAPSPKEAVAALGEFVGGFPVIAHNASFDRTFIESVPGGAAVSGIWIDSLALSRIALPRLSTHRLADLAALFGCDSVTHRADDDVDALAGIWRILLTALSDFPQAFLAKLAALHTEVNWPYRSIFSALSRQADPRDFSLKEHRQQLIEKLDIVPRRDAAEVEGPVKLPSRAEIDEEFQAKGSVGRMYAAYERRPEQLAMAREVRDAIATSTHRALEAGTGVGKSIAYLLPEVLFAKQNDVTVGIATKTNALTDQLVSHELPALSRVLPGGVSFFSLKGYDHYPCLARVERACSEDLPLSLVPSDGRSDNAVAVDMLNALAVTLAFSCQSPEGDLDALGIRWRYVPRPLLTCTPYECQKARCPFYPHACFVHGARRRAASADVVVTNHSLLLRNVMADGRVLPPIRHWVIDEAHGFEAEARRQWAREVAGQDARTAFELLGGVQTGAIHTALSHAAHLEAANPAIRVLSQAAAAVSRASLAMGDFFVVLHDLADAARDQGDYETVTLWIDERVRQTPEWAAILEEGEVSAERLDEASRALADAVALLADLDQQEAANLADAAAFLGELHASLRLICLGEDESYVYSAQLSRSRRRIGFESLLAEKIDVGDELAARWLMEMKSIVFTSATMAIGESFEHFEHAVGLDRLEIGSHSARQLDSSFDFNDAMSVIVCRDLPVPGMPAYAERLADALFDVHVAMGGSVLTLFTNRREMGRVYNLLAPRLAAAGLALVQQEKGASPRRLRERFMAEKELSLFALKAFWEGFDATGDTLRCVVIPRLPFSSPTDPLAGERGLRDRNAWAKYALPDAVLEVKQAAGRLIRSATDSGVLVLADSRLLSKSYGKVFLRSLPSQNISILEVSSIKRYIEMWRRSHRC